MGWMGNLFGRKADDRPAEKGFAPEPKACPSCQRRLLPGATCPFCVPQHLGDEIESTMATPHKPARNVASLAGVVTALAAAREHGARGFLHVYEGDNKGLTMLVGDAPISIGRTSEGNRLALSDRGVSSRHCEVRPTTQALVVADLGSKNGTYVNDQRVPQKALQDGDVLSLGDRTRIYVGVVR